MAKWQIRRPHRRLMVQWGKSVKYSVGIHVDHQFQYVDFHLLFFIVTIGNPDAYEDYQAWWSSRSRE